MKFLGYSALAVIFLFTCSVQAKAEECVYKPPIDGGLMMVAAGNAPIRRGINLSGWWQDEPNKSLSSDDIRHLRDDGFDFVRLPISPLWFEIKDSDEQKKKLGALRCDIISILNQNISVVLDLHAPDSFQEELNGDPNKAVPKIEEAWREISTIIADLPTRRILLSIYNEPLIDTEIWWRMQERIIEDLRKTFPDHILIANSGPFSGWWNLVEKKPYKDLNIVYDFHFYEPLVFTHHGANWNSKEETQTKPPPPIAYPVSTGFKYDVDDPEVRKYFEARWDKDAIAKIIESIAAWRDYYRVRVVCMEFGVYRPYVDDQSRYAWIGDVHATLENLRIPWALWEYSGPFGLLNSHGAMDDGMLHSLELVHGQIHGQIP